MYEHVHCNVSLSGHACPERGGALSLRCNKWFTVCSLVWVYRRHGLFEGIIIVYIIYVIIINYCTIYFPRK